MVWFWDEGVDLDSKVIHPLAFGLEGELASIMVFCSCFADLSVFISTREELF